jgi:CBS domain-containing protein
MKVAEIMRRQVETASPDESVEHAARLMAERNIGALPVGEDDRLVGMVTDRDIAIRIVAKGLDPRAAPIRAAMTAGLGYCFEDQPVDEIVKTMRHDQVRRLPVLDRHQRLVGILSLGDIAGAAGGVTAGTALEGVSQTRGIHDQPGDSTESAEDSLGDFA